MLTPFADDLSIDIGRCIQFCHSLLSHGADGIVLGGTTGEANSLSSSERQQLVEALRSSGVPGERLMIGVGACSIVELAEAMRHSAECDGAAVLMLPPFFYKRPTVSDDGLFQFVDHAIRRSGVSTRIYLYHIPQVTQIGWSADLIRRLVDALGDQIVGVKDSSGDWDNTQQLIKTFPELDIFPGSELPLLKALRAGGVGCITATANINLSGIRQVFATINSEKGDVSQEKATAIRLVVQETGPPLSVMKSYLAYKTGIDCWANVRPPLEIVSKDLAKQLDQKLQSIGYEYAIA